MNVMICSTNSGMMREYYKREIFYSLEKRERKREREREREKKERGRTNFLCLFSQTIIISSGMFV